MVYPASSYRDDDEVKEPAKPITRPPSCARVATNNMVNQYRLDGQLIVEWDDDARNGTEMRTHWYKTTWSEAEAEMFALAVLDRMIASHGLGERAEEAADTIVTELRRRIRNDGCPF